MVNSDDQRQQCRRRTEKTPRPGRWERSPRPLNMNHYANKKSAAESLLDVALLMANASQLKAVLDQGPDFTFYAALITLISISLILQVAVGVLLIFIGETGGRERSQTPASLHAEKYAPEYI
ncbi:ninjurin-1-like [Arapaima gigas]